jgi:hypothetical protein
MFIMKGLLFMETKANKKRKIHIVNFTKILVMVTLQMQALLVAMLFRTIHPKSQFMKRRHSRTLATRLQATYGEMQCPHSVKKLTIIFRYKHQP